MKLKRFFLPMMAMVLLLSGCKKEYVNVTYGSQVETYRVNVTPSQWKEASGYEPSSNNYLYCTLEIPAINDEVFRNGTVQAYVWNVYDVGQNLGAWNLLPFVYPLEVYVTNANGEEELVIVPENMRFEWEKGYVTLIVQDLDGYKPVRIAETLSFRISVIKDM
ncbi:MAG: hypothetical protein IJ785_06070 [Bacteroidales bacterium]|nr:hypothetical protein [Bacteroidales bacterium]